MKAKFTILTGLLLIQFITAQPNVDLELVASGFDNPLSIQHAGDERLFVLERRGIIKVMYGDYSVNPVPFLDIDQQVTEPGGIGDEGGLLGLAFHPSYSSNGFFYVHYTDNSYTSTISRFSVDPSNPDLADPDSEVIILTIPQPEPNHNGGDLLFGPDGYLYIAVGDGGTEADSENHGQRLDTLLGKILRIDVNGTLPYSIPLDNPFYTDGDPNTLAEIWAYGLRNPWRISFDSLTGDLWITDVGQGQVEEINLQPAGSSGGENYGWRCYEGMLTYNNTQCTPDEELQFPTAFYNHYGAELFRCSISGGYRYRGTNIPGFYGIYFFADYCSNEIGMLSFNGQSWDISFSQSQGDIGIVGFGQAHNNELYVAAINNGNIYRLVENTLSEDENGEYTLSLKPNPANDTVNITGSSGHAELFIFNLQGRLIDKFDINSSNMSTFSVKNLAKGLYIVELRGSSGKLFRSKLLKN